MYDKTMYDDDGMTNIGTFLCKYCSQFSNCYTFNFILYHIFMPLSFDIILCLKKQSNEADMDMKAAITVVVYMF